MPGFRDFVNVNPGVFRDPRDFLFLVSVILIKIMRKTSRCVPKLSVLYMYVVNHFALNRAKKK